jgi:hypothetical protein
VNVLAGAPYGYRYVSKQQGGGHARYESVLEEARIVRQIFTWVGQEHCSIGEVCRRLQGQHVPSPKGKSYWDRTMVWGLLKNPACRGAAAFGKTQTGELRKRLRGQRGRSEQPRRAYSVYDTPERAVPSAVPALVSEELFASVGEQLAENRRRQRQRARGARYLLQGLLLCHQCGYAYYGKPVSRQGAKGATRRYASYRCTGTDAYRFGGQRLCQNKQVRTDLLEAAVWDDVCTLLKDPDRLTAEYRRRLDNKTSDKEAKGREQVESLIGKVKRGIARLIDADGEGLVDKEEFEPRIRQFKERLVRLEAQAREQAELESQEQQLGLVIGRLQDFAERVKEGLEQADWSTRRDIIRTLVKRIEVRGEEVRVVYGLISPLLLTAPKGAVCQIVEGAISPALAKRALDGLEGLLKQRFGATRTARERNRVHLVRYADDFIITGTSKALLRDEVQPLVAHFLSGRGLELSHEKTHITHIEDGFDFLGQTVRRQTNGKVLLKPSRKNVRTFLGKIKETLRNEGSRVSAGALVLRLNQQIQGWALYHRHASSKRTFQYVDDAIFWMVWRWARRRHPNKRAAWVQKRYFRTHEGRRWVLTGTHWSKDGKASLVRLQKARDVRIQRHPLIRSEANP